MILEMEVQCAKQSEWCDLNDGCHGMTTMSNGNETAVDQGPAWLSKDFLAAALRDVSVLSWHVQPAVGKGDNFLSTLYRVRVEYLLVEDASEAPPRHIQLIIKVLPHGDYLQEFIHEARFFAREINAYREALPALARFAAARLSSPEAFTHFSPRCFPTARPDTLVLEDLSTHGFKMADRRNLLDLDHCMLVLRRLAHLHATSLAYSAHDRTFRTRFEDDIYNAKNREIMRRFLEPQMECLVDVANTWPNFDRIAKKIRRIIPSAVDKLIAVCREQNSIWKVLNHGDCWINNIMFKYERTGEVTDLRFIDFQISRFASPALDITYFMYTSPQSDVRARHMEKLLVEYCEEFRKTALSLGYTGQLISYKELRDEMRRVLFFGFTTSVGTLATVLAEPDQVMDLSEMTADGLSSNVEVNPFTKLQSTAKFRDVFQQLLPYFDKMQIFD